MNNDEIKDYDALYSFDIEQLVGNRRPVDLKALTQTINDMQKAHLKDMAKVTRADERMRIEKEWRRHKSATFAMHFIKDGEKSAAKQIFAELDELDIDKDGEGHFLRLDGKIGNAFLYPEYQNLKKKYLGEM